MFLLGAAELSAQAEGGPGAAVVQAKQWFKRAADLVRSSDLLGNAGCGSQHFTRLESIAIPLNDLVLDGFDLVIDYLSSLNGELFLRSLRHHSERSKLFRFFLKLLRRSLWRFWVLGRICDAGAVLRLRCAGCRSVEKREA